jgi:hypothetical protein
MITILRKPARPQEDPREPPTDEAAREDVRRLTDLVRESVVSGIARRVLLLRLSALPEHLGRPHHRRLAHEALLPLTGADRARLFRLPNADLTVIWRGAAEPALQACLHALHHLFADDPGRVPVSDELPLILDLPKDAGRLLAEIEASLAPRETARPHPQHTLTPLDPSTLAALEKALAQVNMDRFVRRQRIYAAEPDGFVLAWERRCLAIDEIAETMVPGRSLRADPWLFRRLTRTLDRRLLALLCTPGELAGAGPFSLDLNVASLLAPEFLRFDAALPSGLRGEIVVNLRPTDILADPAAFLFARDFIRARGYRVALAGIDAAGLPLLPLPSLGLDLLLLRWSAALADAALPEPHRIVLCRADEPAALDWGKARGISLYQGRHAVLAARLRG